MLGVIQSIGDIHDLKIEPITGLNGQGGRLGIGSMTNALAGHQDMDGYAVQTDKHTLYVLIDNMQSCCESWGYFASEDDLSKFVGAELHEMKLTDTELNTESVEKSGYYDDAGGIQFVDFVTNQGVFQLAVYNAHNGYYGHGILVAKDDEIVLNEVL